SRGGDTLINYTIGNQGRWLDADTSRGALTAVMALGVVANAGDVRATNYLVENARALTTAQPASAALRLEAATVGKQAVLGLALSGRPEGAQVLQQLRGAQIRALPEARSLLDQSQATHDSVRMRGVGEVLQKRSALGIPSTAPGGAPRTACKSGYVWRVARPTDLVCVTPKSRERVAEENRTAT